MDQFYFLYWAPHCVIQQRVVAIQHFQKIEIHKRQKIRKKKPKNSNKRRKSKNVKIS